MYLHFSFPNHRFCKTSQTTNRRFLELQRYQIFYQQIAKPLYIEKLSYFKFIQLLENDRRACASNKARTDQSRKEVVKFTRNYKRSAAKLRQISQEKQIDLSIEVRLVKKLEYVFDIIVAYLNLGHLVSLFLRAPYIKSTQIPCGNFLP